MKVKIIQIYWPLYQTSSDGLHMYLIFTAMQIKDSEVGNGKYNKRP